MTTPNDPRALVAEARRTVDHVREHHGDTVFGQQIFPGRCTHPACASTRLPCDWLDTADLLDALAAALTVALERAEKAEAATATPREIARWLRIAGRAFEEGRMGDGICATVFIEVGAAAQRAVAQALTPYVNESECSWEGFAYPPRTEPGARALACYLIALQLEDDDA